LFEGGAVFSSSWLARSTSRERAFTPARKIGAGLFTFLFPDECRICDQPLADFSRVPVCRACLAKPEPLAAEYSCAQCRAPFASRFPLDDQGRCALCRRGVRGFDAAYSFGFYENELRKLIHLFKYGRIQTLSAPLGRLLSRALPRELSFDVIVPMPLHWRKRWQRGFNQAELLAHEIGRRTQTPVRNALRRVHSTAPQAGLTSAKRREAARQTGRPAGAAHRRCDDHRRHRGVLRACFETSRRAASDVADPGAGRPAADVRPTGRATPRLEFLREIRRCPVLIDCTDRS
jgi:predicted amidophosphoribosyltransferase